MMTFKLVIFSMKRGAREILGNGQEMGELVFRGSIQTSLLTSSALQKDVNELEQKPNPKSKSKKHALLQRMKACRMLAKAHTEEIIAALLEPDFSVFEKNDVHLGLSLMLKYRNLYNFFPNPNMSAIV